MTDTENDGEDVFHPLSELIDAAFDKAFTKEKPVDVQEFNTEIEGTFVPTYTSIEDYTSKTGKRFRMLKEQKERGLSREEAFTETHLNGKVN